MRTLITLATSCMTILSMYLVGQKRPSGWVVGLANQALWLVFIVAYEAWGLLLLLVFLLVVYSRNLWLWTRREEPHV